MKNLQELLKHEVQDLFSAETQITEALPKLAKAATHPNLKKALEKHLEETKMQLQRLEQAAKLLGVSPHGDKCAGMAGLLKEGDKLTKEDFEPEVLDAAIIGACQKVEHYEISGYGTACYYAKLLGEDKVHSLLGQTLDEEKNADEKLNVLAKEKINQLAMAVN
ncbi:MAG: ferritin-like domain-containing protein [Saprospiraceae bacterium]|nr:ferritin-like domain-containing protein [Saprospiraceae bacterium]